MRSRDSFLQWLQPQDFVVKKGWCKFSVVVRNEFLNHVGTLHGGITFSLADAAFAYAANSHNRIAVALNAQIIYPHAGKAGDILYVEATEEFLNNKTAGYRTEVKNQEDKLIGIFTGVVYRKNEGHV